MAKTQNRKPPKSKACSMGPKKMGRPESWDPELADEILLALETQPKGLTQLCKVNPHWPDVTTIYTWIHHQDEFSQRYWRAKVNQAHLYVDESFQLADEERGNKDNSAWLSTAIGLRKWYAARLIPRLYGEKQRMDNLEEQNAKLLAENSALREHADKYQRDY